MSFIAIDEIDVADASCYDITDACCYDITGGRAY